MTHTVMSEDSKQILRSAQCARIIAAISEMHNITLQEAADIYYNSDTATLIEDGIADLHCISFQDICTEQQIARTQDIHVCHA